ncbi:MAG: aldo/keto reductase, partial [Pseudomonadota bacterium]|nr:aldo/keto reductase [Pseudomonadota bacterium]
QLQQGFITIPSSTKRANQEANLAAFDLALTNEDMQRIARLEANERIANPDFSPEWD